MNQNGIRIKSIVLVTVVSTASLFMAGCNCSKKLEASEMENQMLNQRVADLESQLAQADAALHKATADVSAVQPSYLVVAGDTLWSIAQKQLGNGKRYKEILALNPQITPSTPLKIGSKLQMPTP